MVTLKGQSLLKTCLLPKYRNLIQTYHESIQIKRVVTNLTSTDRLRGFSQTKRQIFL